MIQHRCGAGAMLFSREREGRCLADMQAGPATEDQSNGRYLQRFRKTPGSETRSVPGAVCTQLAAVHINMDFHGHTHTHTLTQW